VELVLSEIMSSLKKPTDVFLITKEFSTPTEFSQHIEKSAYVKGLSYWDALLEYCSKNDIESDNINKLLNASLKSKIESELVELNLIKGKKSNKLPF